MLSSVHFRCYISSFFHFFKIISIMPVLQWYKFMFPREMCAPEHINHYHGIAWLPYCCTVISMARYHFCCCHFCPQQHHQLQCTRDSIICVYIKSWIVENPQACILYYLWLNLNLHFQNYFCSILILLLGSHLRSQLHHSVVYLHHSRQAATYLYVYALIILVLWYVHFAYLYHLQRRRKMLEVGGAGCRRQRHRGA